MPHPIPVPPNPFWPQNRWPSDQFSVVADFCSISSLGLTTFLTVTAGKIKRQLQYRERLTRYQSKLVSHRDQLDLYANAFGASTIAIDNEIARIQGDLVSFKRELKDIESASITEVTAAINIYKTNKSSDNFQSICDRMNTLAAIVENRVQGLMWDL